jgi:MPBQ/MSBQ methyltransferase
MSGFTRRLNAMYEETLDFDFFGFNNQSDFLNFGYWFENTNSHREACENLMEKLLDCIPEKKGTILDVACGKGATTRHLLKYYKAENVTGINISAKQLQICRKNASGCTFRQIDATNLEFPHNSFDTIICVEAAVHFDTREKFLHEAQQVLKPGGRLVLSDALLAVWAPVQPVANYLRNPRAYRQVCLRAGFADAVVVDATHECWGGFSENLLYYLREKFRSGEITLRCFCGGMAWLRRLQSSMRHYVLVSCSKR